MFTLLKSRVQEATFAYQGGARNMVLSSISWLENFVQGDLRPDLTLLLDVPVQVGMNRARQRDELDRFESEKIVFFEQVRQADLSIAAQQPQRLKIIGATVSLEKVQIQQIIAPFIHA